MNSTDRICFSAVVAAGSLIALASTAAAGRGGSDPVVHSSKSLSVSSQTPATAASSPRGALLTVSAINNHGQIVGTLVTKSGVHHGFVWWRGSVKLVGAEADEINQRGEILGYTAYSKAKGPLHPVLWVHGRTRKLRLHGVLILNNRGQVLGSAGRVPFPCPSDSCYQRRPALWTNGRIRLLPFSPGETHVAMNDRGQVVGQTTAGEAAEWQDGTLTDLGPGDPIAINDGGEILGSRNGDVIVWQNRVATDIGSGIPVAINERGEAIWVSGDPADSAHTLLWQDGTSTDLGAFDGGLLSDRGQVAAQTSGRVSVWQNGTVTRLPTPRGYTGYNKSFVVAINDHNQIVGQVCSTDCLRNPRQEFVVLWTLRRNRVETQRLVPRQFSRALSRRSRQ